MLNTRSLLKHIYWNTFYDRLSRVRCTENFESYGKRRTGHVKLRPVTHRLPNLNVRRTAVDQKTMVISEWISVYSPRGPNRVVHFPIVSGPLPQITSLGWGGDGVVDLSNAKTRPLVPGILATSKVPVSRIKGCHPAADGLNSGFRAALRITTYSHVLRRRAYVRFRPKVLTRFPRTWAP